MQQDTCKGVSLSEGRADEGQVLEKIFFSFSFSSDSGWRKRRVFFGVRQVFMSRVTNFYPIILLVIEK